MILLESKMKPEPVEKLVSENHFVLLLWCAWFAEIKCIFFLSVLIIVYRGCYKYTFFVSIMISTVNICPNGVALQTIH